MTVKYRKGLLLWIVCLTALMLSILLSVLIGTSNLGIGEVYSAVKNHLISSSSAKDRLILDIIINIRLPRIFCGFFVGGALACAGVLMQGLFRNPLADPGIIGVSSGGALGAVILMITGLESLSLYLIPVCAFAGCLLAGLVVYLIAVKKGQTSSLTLILAGIALNSLLGAVIAFILTMHIGNLQAGSRILFWLMGGLESRGWDHVLMVSVPAVISAGISMIYALELDILLTGESHALSAGVDLERLRIVILVLTAMLIGSAVAVSGTIGFVGLVIPHIFRLLIGPSHRKLLPICFIGGGIFLIVMDTIVRLISAEYPLRLGVVSAFFGVPFFLYLLIKKQSKF